MTRDEKIIEECLRAAVEGPFFSERAFPSVFGLDRAEVAAILASWPACDDLAKQKYAINSTLNNLLGYPHKKWALWPQYISASPEEVKAVFARWRKAHPWED
ncbi:hypothetical protein [Myxococcus xanthus]|uniref:Uncharacterized protein n=2 Tax=Myxococcus TaxID=32 RepID=A0AAE6FYN5_MYXXA|nr:hypothetical protein [Myxococcus xanthus]QDE67637.1 hypothetical protein BHS09_11950 [Myxococcus xanthus]QDE74914.1 hypothetical protein BHS08_11965 [Myxococcus xanthus]QDE82183.1 hypothetical protein BHS07_11855 [Myxococcus xanthus]QDE96485.1 hypothetical protein BHS05_11895 [Myxococcus xanthus]